MVVIEGEELEDDIKGGEGVEIKDKVRVESGKVPKNGKVAKPKVKVTVKFPNITIIVMGAATLYYISLDTLFIPNNALLSTDRAKIALSAGGESH